MSVYLWAWDPGSVEKFKCYLCGEILCSGLIVDPSHRHCTYRDGFALESYTWLVWLVRGLSYFRCSSPVSRNPELYAGILVDS